MDTPRFVSRYLASVVDAFFLLKNVRSVGTIVSIRTTSSFVPLCYSSQCPSKESTPGSSRVFYWRSVSLISSASNESFRLVSVYLAICMASFHSTQTDTHGPRYTYVGRYVRTYVHTRAHTRTKDARTHTHCLTPTLQSQCENKLASIDMFVQIN